MKKNKDKELGPCIVSGCDNDVRTRGMCGSCYSSALKLIRDGETSWENLKDMCLATEPYQSRSSHFRDTYFELKAKIKGKKKK